jgi:hypothetical protein
MDAADDIMVAVQAIFELVQREFMTAAEGMPDGRWAGLDPDARARIARHAREEVGTVRCWAAPAHNSV